MLQKQSEESNIIMVFKILHLVFRDNGVTLPMDYLPPFIHVLSE